VVVGLLDEVVLVVLVLVVLVVLVLVATAVALKLQHLPPVAPIVSSQAQLGSRSLPSHSTSP
jgi:hypothetical protein